MFQIRCHCACLPSQWCQLTLCDIMCCLMILWFSLWTWSVMSPCLLSYTAWHQWTFHRERLLLLKSICTLWLTFTAVIPDILYSSIWIYSSAEVPVFQWIWWTDMIPVQESVTLWRTPGCYLVWYLLVNVGIIRKWLDSWDITVVLLELMYYYSESFDTALLLYNLAFKCVVWLTDLLYII